MRVRSSLYRKPAEVSAEHLAIVARIDRHYLARRLLLAPDGGIAVNPAPSRQPQAGAALDAAVGTGGDLPASEYEQAGSGTTVHN